MDWVTLNNITRELTARMADASVRAVVLAALALVADSIHPPKLHRAARGVDLGSGGNACSAFLADGGPCHPRASATGADSAVHAGQACSIRLACRRE